MNKDLLVIGDCHVTDGQDLSRFKALGNFIMEKQPDYIIIMGDFMDIKSLSAWDRDKRKKMEGRRYWNEIHSGNEALNHMLFPMDAYNQVQRESKKKQYLPNKIYIMGNHEDRLTRYFDHYPEFSDGAVSLEKNLHLKERGFEVVPYKHHKEINGIAFIHIPIGKDGKAIYGASVVKKALDLYNTSIVFGHTHCWNVENKHRHGSPHLQQALSVGCYFEHQDEYVEGAASDYYRGIFLLHNYDTMRFDLTSYSLGRLKREYL